MIAVSIVTYHTPIDELQRCVSTLLSSVLVSAVDIVDNGQSNYIATFCKSITDKRLSYIPSENRGYGAGNNVSIKRSMANADVKYHLVMNSDIVFSTDTLAKLVAIMENDPKIGLTIPKVTDRQGVEQSSYHPLPRPSDLLAHRFLPRRWCRRRMDRYEIKVDGLTEPINVPYVHGCFMLTRLDALRKVGLFDERFFMYPEDIDLTRRINEHYLTLVVPTLSIVHDHRAESRKSFKMLRIHAVNMIKYFNKWGWFKR